MSVTFWCPEAKRETVMVACDMNVGWTDDDEPVLCSEKERCGYCGPDYSHHLDCPAGFVPQERSEAPELNVSEGSAATLTNLLGLPRDESGPYGFLEPADIPPYLQAVMVALNTPSARAHLATEFSDSHDEPASRQVLGLDRQPVRQGARMISPGVSDESTQRRLLRLQELFTWAVEHGLEVSWG